MSPGRLLTKMCSISVEPMPSRMSVPTTSRQRSPTCAGSASPAETQMRKRVRAGAARNVLVRQHGGVKRWHAEENRRLLAPHHLEHGVGRRPLRQQHRGGADRHRKRHGVAEAVGEEQLGGGIDDVVLADAKHLLAIEFCRRHQARMDVARALGLAGRAGRIEPEGDLVGDGRRGETSGLPVSEILEHDAVAWPRTPPCRRRCRQPLPPS